MKNGVPTLAEVNHRNKLRLIHYMLTAQLWKHLITVLSKQNPAAIYLLKVNNRNTRTMCEVCSKLTIKIPCSSFSIVNLEHVIAGLFEKI